MGRAFSRCRKGHGFYYRWGLWFFTFGRFLQYSIITMFLAQSITSFLQDEETEALLSADFEIGHFFRERVIPKVIKYLYLFYSV